MANITKEFLERALNEKIEIFELNSGSNVGDGYTSILYTIDVTPASTAKGKSEKRNVKHLLLKCYPVHPGRQEWLSNTNLFQKELLVYKILMPELVKFQKIFGEGKKNFKVIDPPVPDFVYGQAVDYSSMKASESKRCLDPLENCIMMPDLRKTGGYKLADRLIGVDVDHCKLIWTAYAKLHALGWVYKQVHGLTSFLPKFQFLQGSCFDNMEDDQITVFYENSCSLFISTIQEESTLDDALKKRLMQSLEKARKTSLDVIKLYLCSHKPLSNPSTNKDNIQRIPPRTITKDAPWRTVTHGDCWLNNMLFSYDELTGKPKDIKLIDLQLTREGDPMADLAYSLYTGTTAELRKNHLEQLQNLYIETFNSICNQFQVDPFPDFGLVEFQRRFHRAKSLGFVMCLIGFPIFLKEAKDIDDLDKMNEEATADDFVKELLGNVGKIKGNPRFVKRVLDVVQELYQEGVI